MLHKAAQFVAENRHGNLPRMAEELCKLPGIGAYTAAAIASIAHGERVAVVDGNVERVLSRLAGWDAPGGRGGAAQRRQVEQLAADLLDPSRPGDSNQAMMELGATVCLPRNPLCLTCPLAALCATRGEHKTAPRAKMLSREVAHALCLRNAAGPETNRREVLLEQRAATQTVMPGMWELPRLTEATMPQQQLRMIVRHAIMQVNYCVRIRMVSEDEVPGLTAIAGERRWIPSQDLDCMALTGLARKVLLRAHLLVPALHGAKLESKPARTLRPVNATG